MMIGFGECVEPREDTLELMELYVTEFIHNMARRALVKSQRGGFSQIQMRDLLKVIENDDKKFLRVPYILTGLQSIEINKLQQQMHGVVTNDNKNLLNA